MTPLDDLVAACTDLANDGHYAAKTRTLARRIAAWAPTVTPAPTPTPTPTPTAPPVPVGALMFADDFTAPLDPAKWDVKAQGTWLKSNVSVHDGLLDVQATRDTAGVWHGGELQGLAPAYQYIGPRYMECRAQVAKGAGTWSAPLWEWGAPWGANHVEIDVCEQLGFEPTKYHCTVHSSGTESKGIVIDTGVVLADAPRRYGAAVYGDRVDFYFSSDASVPVKVGTILASSLSTWPFVVTPMCAVVDLDMGGWGGVIGVSPPVHMTEDYLRVWKLA